MAQTGRYLSETGRPGSARRVARCVACALVVIAAGCASPMRGAEPPRASGREGAVTVEWSGRLVKIYPGAPATARAPINVMGGGGWTAVVRVEQATPDVRPLVDGGWAAWSFRSPVEFFGTNRARVGARVAGRVRIWRDERGVVWGEMRRNE